MMDARPMMHVTPPNLFVRRLKTREHMTRSPVLSFGHFILGLRRREADFEKVSHDVDVV